MWRLLVTRFLVGLFARLLGTPGGIVASSGHDKAAGVACAPSRNRSDGLRSTSKSLGLGSAAGPTAETDQASAKLRSRRIKVARSVGSHSFALPAIADHPCWLHRSANGKRRFHAPRVGRMHKPDGANARHHSEHCTIGCCKRVRSASPKGSFAVVESARCNWTLIGAPPR